MQTKRLLFLYKDNTISWFMQFLFILLLILTANSIMSVQCSRLNMYTIVLLKDPLSWRKQSSMNPYCCTAIPYWSRILRWGISQGSGSTPQPAWGKLSRFEWHLGEIGEIVDVCWWDLPSKAEQRNADWAWTVGQNKTRGQSSEDGWPLETSAWWITIMFHAGYISWD